MIIEMRVYHATPGRMPDLLARFRDHTLGIWEKHGIKQAGFFTTVIGQSNHDLTYFLAWDSMAERERKWGAFQSDPTWVAIRAKTEANGPLITHLESQFLAPTDFSSVK